MIGFRVSRDMWRHQKYRYGFYKELHQKASAVLRGVRAAAPFGPAGRGVLCLEDEPVRFTNLQVLSGCWC